MRPVEFTQHLLPDGRQKKVIIDRPDEIADIAEQFVKKGGRLEIELLATGVISITAELGDDTIAHELVKNGPDVPASVDIVILGTKEVTDG